MQIWALAAAAILVGVLASLQPVINAVLARAVGSPVRAGAISLSVALAGALALLLIFERGDISRETLTSVQWWAYLAGLIGPVIVIGGMTLAPAIGALFFVMCIVAGQLVGATLSDHFGAFGLQPNPISAPRLLGLALVLAGAVLARA